MRGTSVLLTAAARRPRGAVRVPARTSRSARAIAAGALNWPLRPQTKVGLQRLVGRHWRTVSEGTIRRNGRFTLVATPPKGRNLYRVGFPTQQTFASATSRTFTIRGT